MGLDDIIFIDSSDGFGNSVISSKTLSVVETSVPIALGERTARKIEYEDFKAKMLTKTLKKTAYSKLKGKVKDFQECRDDSFEYEDSGRTRSEAKKKKPFTKNILTFDSFSL